MKKQTWKRNALQASLTLAAALGMWGAATIGVERAMANDEAAVETEATLDSLAVPVETVGPPAVEAPSGVPSEVPPSASSDCEECDEYCYQLVREPYFPWRSYYVKRPKKSEAERLADYLLEELPRRLDPNWQPTPIVSPTREGSKTLSEVLTDLAGENKLEDFASETIKNNYLTGRAQFFGLGKEKCDWTNGVKNLKFAQNSVIAQAELALAYALGSDADLEEWDVERSEIEKLAKEAADKYQNPFAQ
ncbi:MAG: hypothetical protein IJ991_06500, partial [Thermoguttaceae bacterium]|nr:hypothetical protein [Thermoguttaceae bacterium]